MTKLRGLLKKNAPREVIIFKHQVIIVVTEVEQ